MFPAAVQIMTEVDPLQDVKLLGQNSAESIDRKRWVSGTAAIDALDNASLIRYVKLLDENRQQVMRKLTSVGGPFGAQFEHERSSTPAPKECVRGTVCGR